MTSRKKTILQKLSFSATLLLAALALYSNNTLAQAAQNPSASYILDGKAVSPWKLIVGNEKEWYIELKDGEGKTVGGNLTVSPSKDKTKNAIFVNWKGRKGPAAFGVGGHSIDIKALEKDVAIAFDLKFDKKVRDPIDLHIDCTYPCRGTIPLRKILKEYPTNEWFTLPIPLTWVAQAGADLSKIDSMFKFQSEGKIKMHIANVRLLRLPKE